MYRGPSLYYVRAQGGWGGGSKKWQFSLTFQDPPSLKFHNRTDISTLGTQDGGTLLSSKALLFLIYVMLSSSTIMAIPVVEFSRKGYKVRKVFLLNINGRQQNEIIEFCVGVIGGGGSNSAKLQSQFSNSYISGFFFHWKCKSMFYYCHFLIASIYFLK